MNQDVSKLGGLFSRVVHLVRPLAGLASATPELADKQALRQTVERKRRNDLVRQHEFEKLRQMRQQTHSPEPGDQAPADTAHPASGFLGSLAAADARAITLKKIDVIEEQMSQQWWDSQPTAPGPLAFSLAEAEAEAGSPVASAGHPDVDPFNGSSIGPSISFAAPVASEDAEPWHTEAAVAPVPPALPAPGFVHDPDFEEAAIAFANGDVLTAEASLLEVLAQRAQQPETRMPVWQALFDLYRATGLAERFDVLAIDFAARVDRSAPLWFSLPEQLGLAEPYLAEPYPAEPCGAPQERHWRWATPAVLTRQSVATLQAAKGRAPAPWTLDWSVLEQIEADAVPLLEQAVVQWAQTPGQISFVGVPALDRCLQAMTVCGDREAPEASWQLRMALLRLMEQPDSFESVALDYCVTYEVSPPSWEVPRSRYVEGLPKALEDDSGLDTDPDLDLPPQPAPQDSLPACVLAQGGLSGCIASDATPWLTALEARARPGEPLVIDCSQLIRLDFAAAGSVLNWSAHMQAQGHRLRFEHLHQLVAVFFCMIGVNEHAQLVARND